MKSKMLKRLKRLCFLSLSVAVFLSSQLGVSATAPNAEASFVLQDNQTVIRFSQGDCPNISPLEVASRNLLASGFTQDFIDNISDDSLVQIAQYDMSIVSVRYYAEDLTSSSFARGEVESRMIEITADEFIQRSNLNHSSFNRDMITVVDENGAILHNPHDASQFQPFAITQNVDGGTIQVTTALFGVSGGVLSQFAVISEFVWTRMPNYRGTDFFGITRDNNTVIIPNAWDHYFAYERSVYFLMAPGGSGPVMWSYLRTHSHFYNTLRNEDANNPTRGFAIRLNMPRDLIPSFMLAGSSANATIYWGARGGVLYQGALQQPGIVPTHFNHWSTYLHQRGTTWLSSPSISVPLGASITVSPAGSYSDPIVDTILARWG